MWLVLSALMVIALTFNSAQGQRNTRFFVSSMKMFRPNTPYNVGVTIFETSGATWTVTVSLQKDTTPVVTKSVALTTGPSNSVMKDINLNIPAFVVDGNYFLDVKCERAGRPTWTNRTMVGLQRKNYMIMIQTDKGIYKPGSVIKFRVFTVNINLVPVVGNYDIFLKDGNGNRIEQWLAVSPDMSGVYSGDYGLDIVTPLGNWTLQVQFKGEKEQVIITVEEYVLPRYDVTVKLPPYLLRSNKEVKVEVDATYTYGEPVDGTASVKVYLDGKNKPFVTQSESQKGTKVYTIDLSQQDTQYSYQLKVVVNFTDSLGGESRSASSMVKIHSIKWKADYSDTPSVIKPMLSFRVRVRVTEQDGTPPSTPSALTVSYQYGLSWNRCFHRNCPIPTQTYKDAPAVTPNADGYAVVDLGIPENATRLSLQATYDGAMIGSHSISTVFKTKSKENIEVTISNTKVNSVSFNVRTTFDTKSINYEVLSKGSIVTTGFQQHKTGNMKEFDFALYLTSAVKAKLAPRARLVVYTLHTDEIIADSVEFDVDGLFKYEMSMAYDEPKKTVGDATVLTVKTTPNAYVGVVAIDQSVLLLKKGNEISRAVVMDRLDEYYFKKTSKPRVGRGKRSIMYPPSGGKTNSHSIFDSAGLVYMTNAKIVNERRPEIIDSPVAVKNPKEDGAKAQSGGDSPVNDARTYFPETWLWRDTMSGYEATSAAMDAS